MSEIIKKNKNGALIGGYSRFKTKIHLVRSIRTKISRKIKTKFPFLGQFRRFLRATRHLPALQAGGYEIAVFPESLISAEYIDGKYSRYDVIVRLLAVDSYFGKNDIGFLLYEKMQTIRGAPQGYTERFKSLIKSVNDNGFNWRSAFDITCNGYLLDGSHRLALALYFNIPIVLAHVILDSVGPISYGLSWFFKNGFTSDECALIEDRRRQLFWEKGLYFPLIFWPPVAEYFEEMEQEIPFEIVQSSEFEYEDAEFEKVVRSIYAVDDIADWKVDKKLKHMASYSKKIRVVWVEFPDPVYRKKHVNHAYISRRGEAIKSQLRNRYKNKVSNYIFDIICHTGDNWQHNREILDIFKYNKKSFS